MNSASFFSSDAAKVIGAGVLVFFGGGLSTATTVAEMDERARYANIFTECCKNFTQPVTTACFNLVGEMARNIDELAKLCEKIPDKKIKHTYHSIVFGGFALLSVGVGLYFGARTIYHCRKRTSYTPIV